MKQFGKLLDDPIKLALAGVLLVGFVYYLTRKTVADVAGAIADVNQGTPYENTGIVGTLGHAADAVSGGTLSDFGSWLGGKLYDLTHPAYDPNAPTSANVGASNKPFQRGPSRRYVIGAAESPLAAIDRVRRN